MTKKQEKKFQLIAYISLLSVAVVALGLGSYIFFKSDVMGVTYRSSTTSVDFTSIGSDVSPDTADTYDLGSFETPWKDVYASGTIYAGALEIGVIAPASTSTFTHGATFATTDGRVGIGTLTPSGLFEVVDGTKLTILPTTINFRIASDTSANRGITFTPKAFNQIQTINMYGNDTAEVELISTSGGNRAGLFMSVAGTDPYTALTVTNAEILKVTSATSTATSDFVVTDGSNDITLYPRSTGIYQEFPNGMCWGEDSATSTPNIVLQLCSSF